MNNSDLTKGRLQKEWEKTEATLSGYHIHIYSAATPSNMEAAKKIAKELHILFPNDTDTGSLIGVVGPHSKENIAMDMTKEGFAKITAWLQLNDTQSLSILIHPETNNVIKDHLESAIWIGNPTPFNESFFERVRKASLKPSF